MQKFMLEEVSHHIFVLGRNYSPNTTNMQYQHRIRPKFTVIFYPYVTCHSQHLMLLPTKAKTGCYIFFHFSHSQHSMLVEINVSDISVVTTSYLLQQINIHWCRGNSQHYMLGDTDFNDISSDTYKL